MADEADLANDAYAEFLADITKARKLAVQKMLPECENECGSFVFVTPQGTRARFCRECWEEFQRQKNG